LIPPTPASLKLAVASKEGLAVSEHFGHATRFWIYEVSPGNCRLLEQRDVAHYCHGNRGSSSAMEQILATIQDCQAVLVARIGDGPTQKLAAIGIQAVTDYAYQGIEGALLDYVAKQVQAGA
jgi:predicted Fe-Mo cluster-binding NifX family protein